MQKRCLFLPLLSRPPRGSSGSSSRKYLTKARWCHLHVQPHKATCGAGLPNARARRECKGLHGVLYASARNVGWRVVVVHFSSKSASGPRWGSSARPRMQMIFIGSSRAMTHLIVPGLYPWDTVRQCGSLYSSMFIFFHLPTFFNSPSPSRSGARGSHSNQHRHA